MTGEVSRLEPGLTGSAETVVDPGNVAAAFGNPTVNVFATPAVVALVEQAAIKCLAPALPDDTISVGTLVEIKHLQPTPVGMHVRADVTLVQVDGRRLAFSCRVWDDKGEVATGRHERVLIGKEKFFGRVEARRGLGA